MRLYEIIEVGKKQKTRPDPQSGSWIETCGEGRNRTADAEIFSLSLYRLSYLAIYLEEIFLIGLKYNFALV